MVVKSGPINSIVLAKSMIRDVQSLTIEFNSKYNEIFEKFKYANDYMAEVYVKLWTVI